jgi:hypothetical protein
LAHQGSITVDALRDERKTAQIKNAYDEIKKSYLVLKNARARDLGTALLAEWKFRKAKRTQLNSLRRFLARLGN